METQRIPLFPLNVVLFPGMALPLHIFEPLYRQMIRRCLDGDQRFGVCLIRSGPEVGGPADPHSVGSLCQIAHVHALEDGRMNLLVVGVSRFQVVRLYHDEAYL
ncbi:MAG: ATP-dependent protease, partial [Armatimonadetes bacterium]|nr:ATP-dependent protease [Armatimonadota bacterium]